MRINNIEIYYEEHGDPTAEFVQMVMEFSAVHA